MTVKIATSHSDGKVTIAVNGRFGFDLHQEFRKAYKDLHDPGARYVVDMDRVEYIDSSALGMLLQLREHAGGNRADVRLIHCRPEIKRILEIANFQKLFQLA